MNHLPASIYYDGFLPCVEGPSRYIDGELNLSSNVYGEERFNILLVFPDLYEIGMSYQGIRYLYSKLLSVEQVGVEFAFAPWPDMEGLIRSSGEQLRSWQTGTPARDFDLMGFSLTYELHYTNLLMMLDLSGISIGAADRGEGDPVVVAGGLCCTNPLPFMNAVDAVFVGDGEESLPEAARILRELKFSGAGRDRLKEALAGIEGVYVEGLTSSVGARTYHPRYGDLPRSPIVPSAGMVHERLSVEIMRGCTRGCRFCRAGMIYRPRRERSVPEIVDAVCAGLDAAGWEEVSIMSLSTSDYTGLDELLERLTPELEKRRVSLALPSLRPETITERIVAASSLMRKSGFTLAPEAGTGRLRRVINKGMSEEEILEGCRRVLEGGWRTLKLYFMIGLPTETEEDLLGIVDLVHRIIELPRASGRFDLKVSISPFVPKPHTPFQWEKQCSIEEIMEKEKFLSRRIRSRRVHLSLREPALSILEGILGRGDGRLWPVLQKAYNSGCRFDGWRDRLRFDLWGRALSEHGLEISELNAGYAVDEPLPWDNFIPGVGKRFLLLERERAFAGELTPDCRLEGCTGCGACEDLEDEPAGSPARPEQGEKVVLTSIGGGYTPPLQGESPVARYRCIYEKAGLGRFLSHLEIINIIQRSLRRSGLPLSFSRGYHPHPRISMGPSLAVGMEGSREFFDFELAEPVNFEPGFLDGLLPEVVRVYECAGPFSRKTGKLPAEVLFRYRLLFDPVRMLLQSVRTGDEELAGEAKMWYLLGKQLGEIESWAALADEYLPGLEAGLGEKLGDIFGGNESILDRKGRRRSCGGCSVKLDETDASLELQIRGDGKGYLTPRDLLLNLLPGPLSALVMIKRLEILYKTDDSYMDPVGLVNR